MSSVALYIHSLAYRNNIAPERNHRSKGKGYIATHSMGAEALKKTASKPAPIRITVLKHPSPPTSPPISPTISPTLLPITETASPEEDSEILRSHSRRKRVLWQPAPPVQVTKINVRTATPISRKPRSLSQSTTQSPMLTKSLSKAPSPLLLTRHAVSQSLSDSSPWLRQQRSYKLAVVRKSKPLQLPPPQMIEPKSADTTPNHRVSRKVYSMLAMKKASSAELPKSSMLQTLPLLSNEKPMQMAVYHPRTPVKKDPPPLQTSPVPRPGSRADYDWHWKGKHGVAD